MEDLNLETKIEENKKNHKKLIITLIIIVITICGIFIYSRYIGTKGIIINEINIKNNKIEDNFHGLKIVHISDIHYGMTSSKNEICNLKDKINLTKPDIVIFTGDLIDEENTYSNKDLIECMKDINASLGKYAISGEEDVKNKNYNSILSDIGFKNLDNSFDLIYKDNLTPMFLAGVSSLNDKINIDEKTKAIYEKVNDENYNSIYKILMIHEPDIIDSLDYSKFDLVLAGHTHNGQITLPYIGGIFLPENGKKYSKSYYKLNNTNFFISNGLGVHKYKLRLFNKPSFNLYRITKKS